MKKPTKDKKKIGRPPIYSANIITQVEEYIAQCQDREEEFQSTRGEKSDSFQRIIRVNIPTIEGLAVHLKVHRDTINTWCKEYSEFSDVIERLKAMQADRLINKGLSGDYNPTIAKVLLAKHGHSDRIDVTSGGKTLQGLPINELPDEELDKLIRSGKPVTNTA